MNRIWIGLIVASVGSVVLPAQQPPPPLTEQPFRIVKSDPALDELIAPDAKLELMAEHIGLSEGPLWIREGQGGYLIFSDVAANIIYKRAADGVLSVFLERSGFTGTDNLNVGQQTISGGRVAIILIGSNGLALDQEGRLVITAMADRAVVRLEKNGTRTLLADRFEGKRLSGPNDVVVKSSGTVYFTDSINGLRGGAASPQRALTHNGFYLVKEGRIRYLGGDREPGGGAPNGITLSPGEKYLYVTAGRQSCATRSSPTTALRTAACSCKTSAMG
jgi:gluconolactonase